MEHDTNKFARSSQPNLNDLASVRKLACDLIVELCQSATIDPNSFGLTWFSDTEAPPGPVRRDIDGGVAGIILALTRVVEELNHPLVKEVLIESARWLSASNWLQGGPLPGLYVGEAGIGSALLRAGQVLHQEDLIHAALSKGTLIAKQPHTSPDVFNGTAGRLRFHLALWHVVKHEKQLEAAIDAGEHLLEVAEKSASGEVFWRIPKKGYGSASGKAFLGYAHGAAGIADVLLDLFETTGEQRFASAAKATGHWLLARALPSLDDGRGRDWPDVSNSRSGGGMWCHGATGVGRFFLHCAILNIIPEALDVAQRAALTAAYGVRWSGSSQCHGLQGSGEFLIDMFQATEEVAYLNQARELASLMLSFVTNQIEERVPFVKQQASALDFMNGKAGAADFLLRMSLPTKLPHLLSLSGLVGAIINPLTTEKLSSLKLQKVQVINSTSAEVASHRFSLDPAFNALVHPDIRQRVNKADFSVLNSFNLNEDARRLLQAAADRLPDETYISLQTYSKNVLPSKDFPQCTFEPCQISKCEKALVTLALLGDVLRSNAYDHSPTDPLSRFALGYSVDSVELNGTVPQGLTDDLVDTGMAINVGNQHQLLFGVLSVGTKLVVIPHDGTCNNHVYIGLDSLVLLEAALRLAPSGLRVADLGTGTGLASAILANRYQQVVATDISETVVAVASLTLALNKMPLHLHCAKVADVASGLQKSSFDLVIANPPWVPSLAADGHLFADGGPTGFDLPGRFIWEGAELLKPGGVALILLTDPTLKDTSRPLFEMCKHLAELDYITTTVPLDQPEVSSLGTRKLELDKQDLMSTDQLHDSKIVHNRLVVLVIERPKNSREEGNAALSSAVSFLTRRWGLN